MAYKLVVTRHAEEDLDEILGYIALKLCSPSAAAHLADEIERRYGLLEGNPHIYPKCSQPILRVSHYRKVPIGNYLLLFQIDEQNCTVYVERFFSGLEDYTDKL